ncbi:MAG: hypothetical protein AB1765_13375 [Candidatus Hydrogenedentota bacterium]
MNANMLAKIVIINSGINTAIELIPHFKNYQCQELILFLLLLK